MERVSPSSSRMVLNGEKPASAKKGVASVVSIRVISGSRGGR